MSYQKHCVGIDISQKDFTACLCSLKEDFELNFSEVAVFPNSKQGFNQLNRWVNRQVKSKEPISFLMEATGVYYENLAYHLSKIKKQVHVVLPNKSKHYFASLNIKSKTDSIDAKVLSQFGVERKHTLWQQPKEIYIQLRNLTRYLVQLQEQRTSLSNIEHSKQAAHEMQSFILSSNRKLIKGIDKQIDSCKLEIEKLVSSDEELNQRIEKICTIKGVGFMTVVTIVAETLGFDQFRSLKQLASYSGYDIVQRESGTSIKGKSRISKKGNRYIRKALYFPAMVASRHNEELKNFYHRVNENKPSKMIGQVAVQRKLLALVYTLWKNNEIYDPNKKVAQTNLVQAKQDNL